MSRKNPRGQDTSYLAEALPAFVSEAQEQIESFEQLMLALEDNPGDREMLDALFRCAHTVKGSAGVFGLEAVVGFTHHVETVLDLVRDGQVALTPELGTLLLQCNDQIRALVSLAPGQAPEPADAAQQAALVSQLQHAAGAAGHAKPNAPVEVSPAAPADEPMRRWQLSVRFGPETFRNGMDPLTILRYVDDLGDLVDPVWDLASVPPLEQLDPETCHVQMRCAVDTVANRGDIESAFVFVRDDCAFDLVEPPASSADIAALLDAQPEPQRLGSLLVGVGAISQAQLRRSLDDQAASQPAQPLGQILQDRTGLSPELVDSAVRKQQKAREAGAGQGGQAADDGRFIRVQASRLDAVINLLGELVIASAGASQLAQDTRQRRLVEANLQITHLVEEIRNGTLQLRMVPIGETFARFRRVVRDTAAELGKDVQLELVGGETELDKSVVERIADPLMHLVRNALDHGLEAPDERQAHGKPGQGRITLSAAHEAGGIQISISDDGRGIQRDKVLQRAWERGLLPQGTTPPDHEVFRLIFEPGFSTAEKVTNLSGRGVGMDVVRRNIEALRGTVNLHSQPGQGSRIEIRLPLTLAIIDGFLVGVGQSRFIFPLETVIEVIEARPDNTCDARGRGVMALRGQTLPVVDLRSLYALDEPPPEQTSVVVIRHGEGRYGVVVDRLLGQHQTVIKPLGKLFRSLRGISGSSILGNGEVALIFDVPALGALAAQAGAATRPPTAPASPAAASAL